jgi:hypothetical protein
MEHTLLPVLVLNDYRTRKKQPNLVLLNNHVPNGFLWSKHCAFTKRYNQQIKEICWLLEQYFRKSNLPLNDNSVKEAVMQFIDIDTDTNTFSSSSATLAVPPQPLFQDCLCWVVEL